MHGVSIDSYAEKVILLGENSFSPETESFPGKLKSSDFAAFMLLVAEHPSVEVAYSLDALTNEI